MNELGYLNLFEHIIKNGSDKNNTLSTFGNMIKYDLRDDNDNMIIPLLTSKYVKFEFILKELLWFIKGDTNEKHLSEQGVTIWNANANRSYLDSVGLKDNEEGDLGPIYGFQWRHFGAEYIGCNANYDNKGIDQLQIIIDKINKTPNDRRLVMSAWNPQDINKMALPPCHVLSQYYVDTNKNELHSIMYQRSCDMALGVPYNIASYSLLTHMIADICGLKAKSFTHFMGDTHIYKDHIDSAKKQLERKDKLYSFPQLTIKKYNNNDSNNCNNNSNNMKRTINDYNESDFDVLNYKHHGFIKYKLIV